jgi:colanic acid biosynthesis glycosyl transferase WcaI
MITQWYDPEGGAAMTFGVIARALHGLGHEVDVLTGFPNYPAGKLHPDYRIRPYLRETRDGVTVHRAPLFVSHDANPMRRAANYASFGVSSTALSLKALGRSDAVLVVLSPPFAAFPALAVKRLRGIPFGVQIQDLWPQSVTAGGMLSPGRAAKAEWGIHALCDQIYRRASFIAVTSPSMAEVIGKRGVPKSKITFVSNWASEDRFHPLSAPATTPDLGPRRPFTVMYAGAMGEVQGLDVVLDAAELLRDNDRVGFLFVGGGVAKAGLQDAVQSRGLTHVTFAPPQPAEQMAEVLSQGNVQLISLRDLPVFANTLPSKLPATLAAGRPIIAAVGGDAAEVVSAANAGEVVSPGSGKQLADAVLRASRADSATLSRWGQSGRRYYEEQLSEKVGVAKLACLLREAADVGTGQGKSIRSIKVRRDPGR